MDPHRRDLSLGQAEQLSQALAPRSLRAVRGQIFHLQQGHFRLAGLVLLGGGLKDLAHYVGKGAGDLEALGPILELPAQLLATGIIQRELPAAQAEVSASLKTGVGGL